MRSRGAARCSWSPACSSCSARSRYFGTWRWLWREWLTSLDPKKIGVMYIAVAGVMLVRGGVDALLMRAQQATSVGDSTAS